MKKSKNTLKSKKPAFSFVVDGKCELWYLQKLKEYENLNINLEPKLPQKKRLKDQYELAKKLSEEYEKVFWIIDFDTIQKETQESPKGKKTLLQEFYELYNKCKRNKKIIILVNNPCLEYWFLLHFESTKKHYKTYDQLEIPLKKHLPDYEKTEKYYKNPRENIYQKLKPAQQTAITNARESGEFDFANSQTGIAEMYKFFNELGKMQLFTA